jgi:pimeloyl-ACP methyl ester carboxylesterase
MRFSQTGCGLVAAALVVAVSVAPAAAQQRVEGQTGPGSSYALDLPAAWNGDLVVYAHGIVDPALPVALPSSQDNFDTVRDALLARGYAVAASSFSENGFALKDAAQRTHQLTGLFAANFGPPARVYLAGHSLGSIAALQLAETYASQYDGALVMCGFVGGTIPEIEYMATARIAFDYFFPGVIPGSVFSIPPDLDFRPGTPLFLQVQGALVAGFGPSLRTLQLARVAGLPGYSNDPSKINAGEIIASALNVIGFNLRYTRNVLQHTNGHIPFENRQVTYAGSFDDAALNLGIQRWSGDPAALNYIAKYYTPTGALQIPVQTLHTDRDPVVPAWHEELYANSADRQGATALLEQRIVTAFGHCAFTPGDLLQSFDRLVTRVTGQ